MALDDVITKTGSGKKGRGKGKKAEVKAKEDKKDEGKKEVKANDAGKTEKKLDMSLDEVIGGKVTKPDRPKKESTKPADTTKPSENKMDMSLDEVMASAGKKDKKGGGKGKKAELTAKKDTGKNKEWSSEDWKEWKDGKGKKQDGDWKNGGGNKWGSGGKSDWKDWKDEGKDWKKTGKDWKSWSDPKGDKDNGWKGSWEDWKGKSWSGGGGRDRDDERYQRRPAEDGWGGRGRRPHPDDDFEFEERVRDRDHGRRYEIIDDDMEPPPRRVRDDRAPIREDRREREVRRADLDDVYETPRRDEARNGRYDPYERAAARSPGRDGYYIESARGGGRKREAAAAPAPGYRAPADSARQRAGDDNDTWVNAKRQRLEEMQQPKTTGAYTRVKVTNIPKELDWRDIREAFENETGQIMSCDMRDGTAFLEFRYRKDALQAVETFDLGELNNSTISVKLI